MSPLNSALLCFFRASCFVQVSIMKVFKSSIDYALRNFVSNLSFFFWWMSPIGTWMSPIGTALLWFFACFLFCSSLNIETIWEFRWTALANVMLRFLSVFIVSTKQCAALLLSRFLFCSSLNHEGLQIFDRLCSAKLCFKSFLFLLMDVSYRHMDVSYRHSAALIFRLLSILFKSQCWNFSRVSVDYTCKCNAEISLWFSMSPLNSALLCFFRASCFVQVSIMKVFKSSIDYALRKVVSNLSFFFWWKSPIGTWMSPIGTALLWFFACFLFCSSFNVETFREFRWTTLANVMLRFLFGFQCLH